MIFDDELPPNGEMTLYFELAGEWTSSNNPTLITLMKSIEDTIQGRYGNEDPGELRLVLMCFSTARLVFGSRGDSRIAELIAEVGYSGLTATSFETFVRHFQEYVNKMNSLKGVKIHVVLDDEALYGRASTLTITVVFHGYHATMQNDTRRNLSKTFPKKVLEQAKVELYPLYWSLVRQGYGESQITVGAQIRYAVKDMDAEKLLLVRRLALESAKNIRMWENEQTKLYLETEVWGYEE